MAGIFSIFSEPENRASLSLNNETSKFKSIGSNRITSAKNFTLNKPKGLSIRSKSDLNVSISYNTGGNKFNQKKSVSEDKQYDLNKAALSPTTLKTPKRKSFTNITAKKLSPNISSPIMQNVVDDFVFKKPSTPKKLTHSSQPESLAYDYNASKYLDEEIRNIFNEDRIWMRCATKANDSIISSEDEGFISDPETDTLQIHSEVTVPLSPLNDVELPDISDFSDDD